MDYHATTPCDPRVVDCMLPYFYQEFGNPASAVHPYGLHAKEAVETARAQVAQLAGAESGEVIFTSGATEAINTVLQGIAHKKPLRDLHIVTCITEHAATLDTCKYLQSRGARITHLKVDCHGRINLDDIRSALNDRPTILSLLHANNEIGVISPIEEISTICKEKGVLLHVDAAQSFGKIPVRLREWGVDFLSASSHKMYGPKGVGALMIRRQIPPLRILPLIHGGGHERGLRSGTINVPGVVGFGKAAEICEKEMMDEQTRVLEMRNALLTGLQANIPGLKINGDLNQRLPGNLNISLPDINGTMLLPELRSSLSVSSGSACQSSNPVPSHVLEAIGRTPEEAFSSIRFGLGRFSDSSQIGATIQAVTSCYHKLRNS